MYSFKIIPINKFLNLSKNEINEIMTFINKENKAYNSPKINIKDFVNKFKNIRDEYSYFLFLKITL